MDSNSSHSSIATGLADVDAVLGGGLPRGRMVELFGPPGCGKSTLGLIWAASAQKQKANVVLVDVERSLTVDWAQQCGLDLDDLVVLRPNSGEEALTMVESLLKTFAVDLVVVDSAAALVADSEMDASMEDLPDEAHTDLLYRYLRRLQMALQRCPACLLFLNQTRAGFENEGRTAGGRSLALYASVRVRVGVDLVIRENGEMAAQRLSLTAIKNKLVDPYQTARVELRGASVTALERKPADRQAAAVAAHGRRAG